MTLNKAAAHCIKQTMIKKIETTLVDSSKQMKTSGAILWRHHARLEVQHCVLEIRFSVQCCFLSSYESVLNLFLINWSAELHYWLPGSSFFLLRAVRPLDWMSIHGTILSWSLLDWPRFAPSIAGFRAFITSAFQPLLLRGSFHSSKPEVWPLWWCLGDAESTIKDFTFTESHFFMWWIKKWVCLYNALTRTSFTGGRELPELVTIK